VSARAQTLDTVAQSNKNSLDKCLYCGSKSRELLAENVEFAGQLWGQPPKEF